MIALAIALAVLTAPNASDASVKSALYRRDQQLEDAAATGNKQIWDVTLAPEALYLDENGALYARKAFLAMLEPLPHGVSGNIKMTDYVFDRSGDVATIVHTDAETEFFHGQTLHAKYLTTETWRYARGSWKLVLTHVFADPKDPPEVTLPPATLAEYAGTYRAGADLEYAITVSNGHLMGASTNHPARPLHVELKDVLFIAGQPRNRKIFQRDAGGRITGYVDRREGVDLVWKREP